MRILLDHNVDRRFRTHLTGHDVRTAREMGWETMKNGALLSAAAEEGFGCVISVDKKLEFEHNPLHLPLPVVILNTYSNALPALLPLAKSLCDMLKGELRSAFYIVSTDGSVRRLPVKD